MALAQRDFQRARARLELVVAGKFGYLEQLPWKLAALAVDSEAEARQNALSCIELAWKEPEALEHPLARQFLDETSDPELWSELVAFAEGTKNRDELLRLRTEIALLRFVPLNETCIESKHALAKTNLRSNHFPNDTSFSLAFRMPEWQRRFDREGGALSGDRCVNKLLSHLQSLLSADRSHQTMSVCLALGFAISEIPTNSRGALSTKHVRELVYHADDNAIYESMVGVGSVKTLVEQQRAHRLHDLVFGDESADIGRGPSPPSSDGWRRALYPHASAHLRAQLELLDGLYFSVQILRPGSCHLRATVARSHEGESAEFAPVSVSLSCTRWHTAHRFEGKLCQKKNDFCMNIETGGLLFVIYASASLCNCARCCSFSLLLQIDVVGLVFAICTPSAHEDCHLSNDAKLAIATLQARPYSRNRREVFV